VTSVVVPLHNAERWIEATLESLVAQVAPAPWEVIAVDNRSVDHSAAIVERFVDRLPLRMATAGERANPAYARNAGARAATGDILIFIDADDAVAPGYVRAMTRAVADAPLVTSRVDSQSLNAPWLQAAHGPMWQTDAVSRFFDFLPATGVNIGVRRAVFEQLGGFPEEFSGSEDIAFCWNAHLAGVGLTFVPDAVYRYRYRESLAGLFAQAANWGRDSVLLYATYRARGMPGRSWTQAVGEWVAVLVRLASSWSRADRARCVVRLGFCVGRLHGSLRYRVRYL
jgi:glycosyltransferase involved in cell wall biosynthesis